MRFQNKIVLITGGSRGIGKACSIAFANEGATIAINFRSNRANAENFVKNLPGNKHSLEQADVSDPLQVKIMVENTINRYGKLDILVNNAGIHEHHPIHGVDYYTWQKEWHKTIATNLIGPANLCYCAVQYMIKQGGGHIVNISSRGAFRGEPDQPGYGASKAGINAMSQSLAQSLAKYKISVGVVAPGFVETEMVADILNGPRGESIKNQSPLSRVAKPEEVAHAVLFLAEPKSFFSTGAIIDVNGASYLRT